MNLKEVGIDPQAIKRTLFLKQHDLEVYMDFEDIEERIKVYTVCTVSDNSVGIPRKQVSPFYRDYRQISEWIDTAIEVFE